MFRGFPQETGISDDGKHRTAVLERAASLRIHKRGNQDQIT
jgi:hypothetical protein